MARQTGKPMSLGDLALIVFGSYAYVAVAASIGGLVALAMLVGGVLFLGFSAWRWGVDSREGIGDTARVRRRRPGSRTARRR